MRPKRWISSSKKNALSPRRRKDFRFHDKFYNIERAREGRELEDQIGAILLKMVAENQIMSSVHHPQNSQEDLDGKDFTVQTCNGMQVSFGVTCSFRSYKKYFHNHLGQECLWMMTSYSEEEMRQTLIRFFERIA